MLKTSEDMMRTTMPPIWQPLMDAPTIRKDECAWCGSGWPLNQHHIVFRSRGELVRDGRRVEKPTITLCGSGNTGGCHGKAHSGMLHFKYDGRLMGLETERPVRYSEALKMDGWRAV